MNQYQLPNSYQIRNRCFVTHWYSMGLFKNFFLCLMGQKWGIRFNLAKNGVCDVVSILYSGYRI